MNIYGHVVLTLKSAVGSALNKLGIEKGKVGDYGSAPTLIYCLIISMVIIKLSGQYLVSSDFLPFQILNYFNF